MQKTLIYVLIGVIVLGGVGYYAYTTMAPEVTAPVSDTTTIKGPGYTIETIPVADLKSQMPNLDREIAFTDSVPEAARAVVRAKVATLTATLKKDLTNAGAWLDLGVWYHTANDNVGARDVWVFLTKVAPQDSTAFLNLGRLYHFDLKDFTKAESYFLAAKKLNPKDPSVYTELFQLYTLSLKSDAQGVAVIREAEAAFPQEVAFPFTLGAYYRDQGKAPQARVEFEKALSIARTAGKLELVSQITAELAKLP